MSLTHLRNLVQGTPEWDDARRGMVTASVVGQLVSARALTAIDYDCPACEATANNPCWTKRTGMPRVQIKTMHPERVAVSAATSGSVIEATSNPESRSLTALLVAERITGWTDQTYVGYDMERGWDDEPRAVEVYSEKWTKVTAGGFMVRDDWGFSIGYSPDGLSGDDGILEIKSRRPKKHLQTVLADAVPPENVAQIQCGLLVSGRDWCDYVSYSGGLALWVRRVYPDPAWQAAIVEAVAAFETAAEQMTADYLRAVAGMPMTERTPDYSQIRF